MNRCNRNRNSAVSVCLFIIIMGLSHRKKMMWIFGNRKSTTLPQINLQRQNPVRFYNWWIKKICISKTLTKIFNIKVNVCIHMYHDHISKSTEKTESMQLGLSLNFNLIFKICPVSNLKDVIIKVHISEIYM